MELVSEELTRVPIKTTNNVNNDQQLLFFKTTRRIPLLIFWIFLTLSVLVAGCLAHNRSSWTAFWNQEAVLDRNIIHRIPLATTLDYFTTKLNFILIKGGWIVAMIILISVQSFYILLVSVKRHRSPALRFMINIPLNVLISVEIAVLLLGTFYFLILTKTFTWISNRFGSCTTQTLNFSFPVTVGTCVEGGSVFRGFDISGHCFLIVHSCLLVLEYASKIYFVWKCGERNEQIDGTGILSEKDSDLENQIDFTSRNQNHQIEIPKDSIIFTNSHFNRNLQFYSFTRLFLLAAVLILCVFEFLIFLQTILFYHTVLEKLMGTFIGAGFWLVLYSLSIKYPHMF